MQKRSLSKHAIQMNNTVEWRKPSSQSLPHLHSSVTSRLRPPSHASNTSHASHKVHTSYPNAPNAPNCPNERGGGQIFLPLNEECTSLSIPPSGRHVVAGFSDGTLRLFDLTDRLWRSNVQTTKMKDDLSDLFSCESSEEEEEEEEQEFGTSLKSKMNMEASCKNMVVSSKSHQNFGAVACQIHARGVITSLLMHVACAEDGLYAFGGVLRGSTELVAVDLSKLELYHDDQDLESVESASGASAASGTMNILDLITVFRHSDAKLKGFGACKRLQNGRHKLEYRLFTGKGIKNMHIWSFIPPQEGIKEPIWQCLYDTPTNGNTIGFLHFRYDVNGLFQGITKSDDQKLRVWNLAYDQQQDEKETKERIPIIQQLAKKTLKEKCQGRPKRPPYVDVRDTENSIGVYGSYVLSGGDVMYNKIGIMFLDVKDIQSPYNHTEFAFPNSSEEQHSGSFGRRSGRQQRGDLKSIINIAGLEECGSHCVLELSDGSLIHYCQSDSQTSTSLLSDLKQSNYRTAKNRKLCLSRIGAEGMIAFAVSSYDMDTGRGSIVLKELSTSKKETKGELCQYWGYHGAAHFKSASSSERISSSVAPTVSSHLSGKVKSKSKLEKKVIAHDGLNGVNGGGPVGNRKSSVNCKKRVRHESVDAASRSEARKKVKTLHKSDKKKKSTKKKMSQETTTENDCKSKRSQEVSPPIKITQSWEGKAPNQNMTRPLSPPSSETTSNTLDGYSTPTNKPLRSSWMSVTVSPEQQQPLESDGKLTEAPMLNLVDKKNSIVKYMNKKSKDITKPKEGKKGTKLVSSRTLEKTTELALIDRSNNIDDTASSKKHSARKNGNSNLSEISLNHSQEVHPRTSEPLYRSKKTSFTIPTAGLSLARIHDQERKSLQNNHHASFRKLRNTILFSFKNMAGKINTKHPVISSEHRQLTIDNWFGKEICLHQKTIENMLHLQRMEASTLAATQTVEAEKIVSQIEVFFPFPEVFDEAQQLFVHFDR